MPIPWLQVEGKYLFHPYIVHFPIALFMLEAFLIVLWSARKDEVYERFSFFALKAALFVMPFVMVAGALDAGGLVPRVQRHAVFAFSLLVVSVVRFIFRFKVGPALWQGRWKTLYLVLVLVSVVLTIFTGHFGGKLVYF
jgi:uncharacterized membrane protein